MMTAKTKITVVIPIPLQKELKAKILQDGYSLKSKSRWIVEAIETLLKNRNYPDLVKLNDMMKGFQKLESFVVPRALKIQLDEAVIDIRKIYPEIEGVQSRIVRTAIVQRLIRF